MIWGCGRCFRDADCCPAQTCHWRPAGQLVLSSNRPHTKGHSVIPAPRTTGTQSGVWLSRLLLHLIMSGLADTIGTPGPVPHVHPVPSFWGGGDDFDSHDAALTACGLLGAVRTTPSAEQREVLVPSHLVPLPLFPQRRGYGYRDGDEDGGRCCTEYPASTTMRLTVLRLPLWTREASGGGGG